MKESGKYQVILLPQAANMLERHIAFLTHVSKPAARAKKKEILDAIRSLRQMPQRFPFLEDPCFPQDVYHKLSKKTGT